MEDSIFTKITRGEIPSYKVYEDDKTFAFLDIHPITPGHTLVIPKKQIEFLWDLDDDTYKAVMDTVKKVGLHVRKTLAAKYVGVKVIGTDVPHVHVHVVPFNKSSEYYARPDLSAEPDFDSLAKIHQKLKM